MYWSVWCEYVYVVELCVPMGFVCWMSCAVCLWMWDGTYSTGVQRSAIMFCEVQTGIMHGLILSRGSLTIWSSIRIMLRFPPACGEILQNEYRTKLSKNNPNYFSSILILISPISSPLKFWWWIYYNSNCFSEYIVHSLLLECRTFSILINSSLLSHFQSLKIIKNK